MSHGAIRTLPLFRMRFTFPEVPVVYAYSRAASPARSLAGSAANHTGVLTPSPLFLKVSRFKYFCPANASKLIASLLSDRWGHFTREQRKKGAPVLWGRPFFFARV